MLRMLSKILIVFVSLFLVSYVSSYRNTQYNIFDRDVEQIEVNPDVVSISEAAEPDTPSINYIGDVHNFDLGSVISSRLDSVLKLFNSPFNSKSIFQFPENRRWWLGSNVCMDKTESVENLDIKKSDGDGFEQTTTMSENSSSKKNDMIFNFNKTLCQETLNEYTCSEISRTQSQLRTTITKQQCCFGSKRNSLSNGCEKIELKSIPETLTKLGATEFLKILTKLEVLDKIGDQNVTIFVPDDQTFNSFTEKMFELNKVEVNVETLKRRKRRDAKYAVSTKDLLMNHIVKGIYPISDILNPTIVKSLFENRNVKIDVCRIRNHVIATANCIPIEKRNIYATNAIMHKIDGVMKPISHTILELVSANSDVSMFYSILKKNNLEKFFDDGRDYTLFIPNNNAIMKLESSVRESLMSGETCAVDFVKNHIIVKELCACTLNGYKLNSKNKPLKFEIKRENDTVRINNKALLLESNVLAKNGIIHVIDTILYPENIMSVKKILSKDKDISSFVDLVKKAHMFSDVTALKNVTFFIPVNQAIDNIQDTLTNANQLIDNHIVKGTMKPCHLSDNDKLETISDGIYRFNRNKKFDKASFSINCAEIVEFDATEVCGAMVYKTDRILVPPTKNLLDLIGSNPEFSTFSKIVEGTDAEQLLSDESQSLTLLVLPDSALKSIMTMKKLRNLVENKVHAYKWLQSFILKDAICCSNVGTNIINFDVALTAADALIKISRNSHNGLNIGQYKTIDCDIMATNGIIHTINMSSYSLLPGPFQGAEYWFLI